MFNSALYDSCNSDSSITKMEGNPMMVVFPKALIQENVKTMIQISFDINFGALYS